MSFVERLAEIYERGESGLMGSRMAFRQERFLFNVFINFFELRDRLIKTLDRESNESVRTAIPLLRKSDVEVEDSKTIRLRERKVISAVGTAGRLSSLVRKSELPDNMRELAYLEGMLFVSIIESVIPERAREHGMKYLRSWVGFEDLFKLQEKKDKAK